jgi:sugar phosphate isomerase/epimerase
VKMVLDVAHASLRGETLRFLERFRGRIGHVHISDNRGRIDEHLPLGGGLIDWKGTVEAIKSSAFDGWVVIESFTGIDESLRLLKRLLGCV